MVKPGYQSLSCQDIVTALYILGNWSADKWFVPGSPMKFATDVWGQLIQMPTIHNWEVRIQFLGAPN